MKEVRLTQGKTAIVDDEDFERVNLHKWHYVICSKNSTGYAATNSRQNGKRIKIYLHKFIYGGNQENPLIDHKNRNGLDNRKENLRPASRAQNSQNSRYRNKLLPKGVSIVKGAKSIPFCANVTCNGKPYRLGRFPTAKLAALAYDRKAKELFGEFAYLNFPESNIQLSISEANSL